MAVFASSDELIRVMRNLWGRIKADKTMHDQLVKSRLSIQFRYREPEATVTVDCSDGENFQVIEGDFPGKPVIEMSMKSDVAHDFWMGRVSIPVAILTGKIVSKGPTPKALALLPVIRPAFDFYPEVLAEAGKSSLAKK